MQRNPSFTKRGPGRRHQLDVFTCLEAARCWIGSES